MHRINLIGIVFCSLIMTGSLLLAEEAPKKTVLTMGRATDKVTKDHKKIEPIITYLASKLKDRGIEQGEVMLAGDNKNSTVIEYLKEGKLDLVLETLFSAILYEEEANALPILLIWREGISEYNTFIFVRKDSGIRGLEDLKGKIIAFEDPGSTSGYLLPKCTIKAKGFGMVKLDSFDSPVPEDKIGYVFSGSELNVSSWVFYKKVAAGALASPDWVTPDENPEAYRKEFNIIYETEKIPRMLVIVREGLDENLVARIKEELLNMDKTEEGREALKNYKINKFEDLPAGGPEAVLRPANDLLKAGGVEIH
ncbi:MAG: phosphate/phosphite/phosphonate ABC transporter substrate-binding protein [Candidatus Omnitrophota bacterium]